MLNDSPLRILTVANVPPDPNSGAAGTVYATNVALRELGHDVDEIWADQLGPRKIRHGNLHSLLEQPRVYRREVLKATSQKTYDVVMISQPQGYLAAKALKHNNFHGAVVNRSHGLELRVDAVLPEWHRKLGVPESRQPWLTAITKRLLHNQWTRAVRWFDGIILPSFDDRDFLAERFGLTEGRAVTIHHGVPESFLTTDVPPMTDERRKRLLYIGQHSFIKGPQILAEVVNRTLVKDQELTMTWVTAQSAHTKIRQSLNSDIADRVQLENWVAQEELLPLLDDHGVFIFPSFFEGAGKACAEAISRGLYVIASDTGGMRDHLMKVGQQGLCLVGDTSAFAKTIHHFSTKSPHDLPDREQMISYARRLTWQSCARRLAAFYRNRASSKTNR